MIAFIRVFQDVSWFVNNLRQQKKKTDQHTKYSRIFGVIEPTRFQIHGLSTFTEHPMDEVGILALLKMVCAQDQHNTEHT